MRLSPLCLSLGIVLCCNPFREAIISSIDHSPVPTATCAVEAEQRCDGNIPVQCHADDHRWWPTLARNAQGVQRVCEFGCRVDDGIAYCPGESVDAGVDAE